MIRNDYFKRLVEQFTQSLAIALGFKKAKEYQKALSVIHNTFQQLFGVDADFIDTVPEEDLLILLRASGTLDIDRTVMIAAMQKLSGEIYEIQGEEEACYYAYLKSLTLSLEVMLNGGSPALQENIPDIDELIVRLADYNLPYPTNVRLWRYYENTGNYAKAEDTLYDLLEDEAYAGDIVSEGINFYERLLAKNDAELSTGRLPRDEVEEGLEKLRKAKY